MVCMVAQRRAAGCAFFFAATFVVVAPLVVQSAAVKSSSPTPVGLLALIALCALMLVSTLYAIFVVAPVEMQMGIVQKIFYFHVPSAYAMYVGFGVSALGSALFLFKRDERFDALAVAGAEVGLMFTAIVLVTGPLWARKAWGVYWTWDPRLTTTLLAGLVFASMLMLRSTGDGVHSIERRFAAALSLVGVMILPVIHYSVQRWRGQHPTVITGKGGGLAPNMLPAFFMGLFLFTLIAALLIWMRVRVERDKQQLLELTHRAVEAGVEV